MNLSDAIEADFLDMVALGGRMPDDSAPPGNMSNRRITDTHFTVEFPGYMRGWLIDLLQKYDILNIHWASFLLGLAEIDELSRRGMPILFTCHDYYYFSGGCHYPATCKKLPKGCIACPQVNTEYCPPEVISRNRSLKKAILSRPNVYLAAPSAFLVNEAITAGMIPEQQAFVLRNPYSPIDGLTHKQKSETGRVVLLADSMTERRKAMPLAIESLKRAFLAMKSKGRSANSFVVEIIGNADEAFMSAVENAGFQYSAHGKLTQHEEIATILNRSDILLTCSLEDNWPNVLVEAGAYGVVPVVGPGHGCEEFVKTFGWGKVAEEYSSRAFCAAIVKALEKRNDSEISNFKTRVLESHEPRAIATVYQKAMETVLALRQTGMA